ncbi:MAG TPA: 16S rRNA (adenine(1518)-N(6)/adenine(1519)-N(6))-dimethyltransferase RsmA [Thermoplasmata archaeon]|nr:16S rRNA (adenine(1518)-N(6)/adenine(1519)-N(6))-dimethyltransferase RsmA [Thermoplasmata archaeon]
MQGTSTGSSSPRNPPYRAPTSAVEVAAALDAIGVRPSRRLGQSFLVDPFVADAEAALVGPGGPVLEVGGGLGVLTEALLRRGVGPLRVLERDPRLAAHLRRLFGDRATILLGDALDFDPTGFPTVAGNLPFSIATPLLIRWMELRVPRIVALVQREVAARLGASPGGKAFGRLTLLASVYGSTELFRTVPPSAFAPAPEVTGQILVHTARPGPLPVPDVGEFEEVVRRLFGSRRKKLANLLPRVTAPGETPAQLAERAGWPSDWADRRPETVEPEAWFRLADAVHRARPDLLPPGSPPAGARRGVRQN